MEVLLLLYFLVSTSANLIVYTPEAVREEFKARYFHGEVAYSLGDFGNPPYGSEMKGRVFFNPSNELGCESFEKPPEGWDYFSNSILLVRRGECYFVTKVSNAESIGAKAVIIVDNIDEPVSSFIMSDSGTEGNLSIPALLITRSDGQVFIDHIQDTEQTWISISFHLKPSGQSIHYDLWTSAENIKTLNFLHQFAPTASSFTAKQAKFTPRYILYDWSSDQESDCLAGGRYCSPYRAMDDAQIQGRDIVMEDLRRLCIYNTIQESNTYEKWFNYHFYLPSGCVNNINPAGCSNLAMKQAGINKLDVDYCIQDSIEGDNIDVDDNSLLRRELEAYKVSNIRQYPALFINGIRYRGDLEKEPVLMAMCDSFSESSPKICKQFNDKTDSANSSIWSKWAIFLLAIFCLAAIIFIFFVYRLAIRRQLTQEMKAQVNSSVSQYFALSDSLEMRGNERSRS